MGLISGKLCRFLIMFLTGFTSISVLLLFPLLITIFVFVHGFFYIFSNTDEILSINPFPPLENSDHVIASVSIGFTINSKQDALLHCIAYNSSGADWDALHDHLRDVQ